VYGPTLAVGSAAQLAATHCLERTLDLQSAPRQIHLCPSHPAFTP